MKHSNPQGLVIPIPTATNNQPLPPASAEYVEVLQEDVDDEALEASECHFIESNTSSVKRADLSNDLVPSFASGELVISNSQFIDSVEMAMKDAFYGQTFGKPSIRCSHQIRGRKSESLKKDPKTLTDNDYSRFWQRMCFCIEVTSQTRIINGEEVRLTIGGTTSLHDVNLYSKRSCQHYSVFVAWKCRVCSNLMIQLEDGLLDQISCMNASEIYMASAQLFSRFNFENSLRNLEALGQVSITTNQFATLIGKLRLLSCMPTAERKALPNIEIGDAQTLAACRNFINGHFGLNGRDYINGFELLNCFNDAVKNSYIHNFCSKNANCVTLAEGVCNSILGTDHTYDWFLES
jgi:hypothetical protein